MSAHDEPAAGLLAELRALLQRARAAGPETGAELGRVFGGEVGAATAAATGGATTGGATTMAEDDPWAGVLGDSEPMRALRARCAKFGPADAPVLLTGERGTGKERIAHALHALSRRRKGPFVAENCAAIPDTLLESVLFGHKKGAFTGAIKDHPGHFVAAHGGTLFLDEIGEMKQPLQAKLLRALQEGEVRAVGDSKARKVDVRVIAATNQNLEAAVREKRFREDLYFRLNVLRLELPPLRERGDDVVLLARRFLADASATTGRPLTLADDAAAALRSARWPGNVRQLQNEMQRLAALCDGPEVHVADLSPDARG